MFSLPHRLQCIDKHVVDAGEKARRKDDFREMHPRPASCATFPVTVATAAPVIFHPNTRIMRGPELCSEDCRCAARHGIRRSAFRPDDAGIACRYENKGPRERDYNRMNLCVVEGIGRGKEGASCPQNPVHQTVKVKSLPLQSVA